MAFLRRLQYARSALFVLGVILSISWAPFAAAQEVIDREYDIKAAILYNLAKKTSWPKSAFQDPKQPFVIAIIEPNRFGNRFSGRRLHGRPIVVRTIRTVEEIPECQLLFLPSSRVDILEAVRAKLGSKPVLWCGDGAGFAEKGVMVNLVERDNAIRIEVNLKSAEAADLTISAEVLKLTTVRVVGGEPDR